MLRFILPVELISNILIYTRDVSNAIKLESTLLGLPQQRLDASTYDELSPHDFPASMALTVRSVWSTSELAEPTAIDENGQTLDGKLLSLCEVYWFIKFRPHILMWSKGNLWQRMAYQNSFKILKALHHAKVNTGFPLDLLNKAIEMGNIRAVDYLWGRDERMKTRWNYYPIAKAAGNGHLHMLKYLEDEKGLTFGEKDLEAAMEAAMGSGQIQVIEYLLPKTRVLPFHMNAAARTGQLDAIKLFLNSNRWSRKELRRMKKAAISRGQYELLEYICMNSGGFNSVHIALAKLRAFLKGSDDVFAHYRGMQRCAPRNKGISRIFEDGNARVAQNLNIRRHGVTKININLHHLAKRGDLECVKVVMQKLSISQAERKGAHETALVAGHLHVAEYLQTKRKTTNICLDRVVESGDLNVIKHVFQCCKVEGSCLAMDRAAELAFFAVLKYLHERWTYGCSTEAMDRASGNGHLDIVIWLHNHRAEGCTVKAMDTAAGNGHLEIVKWLHLNRSEGCTTEAMDSASKNGHLHVVKWLHENRLEGCTTGAMDDAAANNHLDVVKFLHFHRSEGCTTEAMDKAASTSLQMVQFLHTNRSEGCTTEAMDSAAARSNLDILLFLHYNRDEGCTSLALDNAAMLGLVDTVRFLTKHRTEGCTEFGFAAAIAGGHVEVAKLLNSLVQEANFKYLDLFFDVMRTEAIDVAKFLLEEGLLDVMNHFVMESMVDHGYLNEVMWLYERGCPLTFGNLKTLRDEHSLSALRKWLPELTDDDVQTKPVHDLLLYPFYSQRVAKFRHALHLSKMLGLLPFPVEIFHSILIHTRDIRIAIQIESILLGLPHHHVDASTAYDALHPKDFPASMALSTGSAWSFSDLSKRIDRIEEMQNTKPMSLCHVHWIIQFRPDLLMRGFGSLCNRVGYQGTFRMFKALHKAKSIHGFPINIIGKAVEAGNFEAVELFWSQNERVTDEWGDYPTLGAAGNGHLEMLEYLHSRKGLRFGGSELKAAAKKGHLEVVRYLVHFTEDTIPAVLAATKYNHVDVVKFLIDHGQFELHQLFFIYERAIEFQRYDLLEAICLHPTPHFKKFISQAKWKAWFSRDRDVFARYAHYIGLPLGAENYPYNLDRLLWDGNARLAQIFHRGRKIDDSRSPLDTVAGYGHLECVKIYLEHSNQSPLSLSKAIEAALTNGHRHVAEHLCRILGVKACAMIDMVVESRSLKMVEFAFKHCKVEGTYLAMDKAAEMGCFDIVRYLHDHSNLGCSTEAMDMAAGKGYLDIVVWLHSHRKEGCTVKAMDTAAENGYLHVVKWLHLTRKEGCTTEAMDAASKNGYLQVVKWLHENRSEGCTTEAMDMAATNNHLDVVKFLHFHRSEGCTTAALDAAAGSHKSSFPLVKFLHFHRSEGCTTKAMDNAAARSNSEILRFLHFNRNEGCTTLAMDRAAMLGYVDTVEFLTKHRKEGCTKAGLGNATAAGFLDVVKILVRSCGKQGLDYWSCFLRDLRSGRIDMVRFFLEEGLVEKNERTMMELVKSGYLNEVIWMNGRGCDVTVQMVQLLNRKHPVEALRRLWPEPNFLDVILNQ
ncbi:hypothetical protein HDU97_000170 [Phlyctochytrium planicorne]|nr:hypothetical protein HDU97_000170 [Phlyctochytrium planicorne]